MAVDPNLVIAKANELKEAQERVAVLEAELKLLIIDGVNSKQKDSPLGDIFSDFQDAVTLTDKIVELLERNSGRPFHFKEIFRTVGDGNEASVRTTIAKLINDGRIRRLEWGKYQALTKEEKPKTVASGLPPPPRPSF
jgi:hypothetical protein